MARFRTHDCRTRTIDRERVRVEGEVAVAPRGRGARDKNGARSTRELTPPAASPSPLLLFPHKCRVCDAPPTDRPGLYPVEKTAPLTTARRHPRSALPACSRLSPPPLLALDRHPRVFQPSIHDWEARACLTLERLIMRQSTAGWIDGWHENGFGIGRGRGGGRGGGGDDHDEDDDDDRLKDFGGFRRFLVSCCTMARREEVSFLLPRGCASGRERHDGRKRDG